MDINEMLSKFKNDLQDQMDHIYSESNKMLSAVNWHDDVKCPKCGQSVLKENHFCPYCGHDFQEQAKPSLPRLKHDDRLEESSKSRIGTFEKEYQNTFFDDSQIPIQYDFDDLDYAPLVSTLSSVLEIELSLSIWQYCRELAGIDMQKYANRNCGKKEIDCGRYDRHFIVNFGQAEAMLGTILAAIEKYSNEISQRFNNNKYREFTGLLADIIQFRNAANHKSSITKDSFIEFYEKFAFLFNNNIDTLMNIKYSYSAKPRRFSYDEEPGDSKYKKGVILTNTRKLSLKYFNDLSILTQTQDPNILKVSSVQDIVTDAINNYIENCAKVGINYTLLDFGEEMFMELDLQTSSWKEYLSVLDDYCIANNINSDDPWGLFIIGGNDVIPIPVVTNPDTTAHQSKNQLDALEQRVEADLLYAFESCYIQTDKSQNIIPKILFSAKPRFYVGRLPLEDGYIETEFNDDIYASDGFSGYLNRALKAHLYEGISIQNPMMVCGERMIPCASEMVNGLPMAEISVIDGSVANNMFVSPELNIDLKDSHSKNYLSNLDKGDMLIFALHGGKNARSIGFYGDGAKIKSHPLAFHPYLLKDADIRVITGVCCWGARYVGYKRENSALLQSIYHRTLLYMGSCRSAIGTFSSNIGYSEALVKHFSKYLLQGIDSGEALIKAKYSYLTNELLNNNNDDVTGALLTILEFNLFGDPLLHVKPLTNCKNHEAIPSNLVDILPGIADNSWRKEYSLIYSKQEERESLTSMIRSALDNRLREINNIINENLYIRLGLEPKELSTVHMSTNKKGEKGYSLCYEHECGDFTSYTYVRTDTNGNIINMSKTF